MHNNDRLGDLLKETQALNEQKKVKECLLTLELMKHQACSGEQKISRNQK